MMMVFVLMFMLVLMLMMVLVHMLMLVFMMVMCMFMCVAVFAFVFMRVDMLFFHILAVLLQQRYSLFHATRLQMQCSFPAGGSEPAEYQPITYNPLRKKRRGLYVKH